MYPGGRTAARGQESGSGTRGRVTGSGSDGIHAGDVEIDTVTVGRGGESCYTLPAEQGSAAAGEDARAVITFPCPIQRW